MDVAAPKPRRSRREAAPITPDPIEIAMEAEAGDRSPDSPARRVLLKHETLIDAQVGLVRWQLASERAGFVLKCLMGAAGLAGAIGLAAMVWQASQARGLVVEAFSVPPDLAGRGLTGQVVASQLLDHLSLMQAKTRSARGEMRAENGWAGGLKVEIPQTGISLGELNRYLRERLGHETRLAGEMVRTPAGLVLTVRTGDVAGNSVAGAETDLDKLMRASAEGVYKQTQPFRYVRYLLDEQRYDEYLPALQAVADGPPGVDAATAKHSLSRVLLGQGDVAGATRLNNDALAMAPEDPVVVDNFRAFSYLLGHEEARRDMSRRLLLLTRRRSSAMTDSGRVYAQNNARADLAETSGDFLGAARWELGSAQIMRAAANTTSNDPGWVGSNLALAHDAAAADAAFAVDEANPSVNRYLVAQQELRAAVALERWPEALSTGEALRASITPSWNGSMPPGYQQRMFTRRPLSLLGLAMVKSGDLPGGEALIKSTPLDCYDCVRIRGQLAAVKRDWRAADHWFGEAVKMAPSIPYANADWGRILLDRGDAPAAITRFKAAHRTGPLFADPLEGWGEALLKQGDAAGAVARFNEANSYAPNWGRLHLKWGEALAKLGKADEAQAQWRTAAKLHLTPDERAELARVQGAK